MNKSSDIIYLRQVIMDLIRTIELKKTILENNDADADRLRSELDRARVFYINVMSAPGSGKTSLLVRLIGALKDRYAVGVMEADIDGDVDAYAVRAAGARSIQLHTGGMCHLDADMSRQGFKEFGTDEDIVFLENIGNLVCPAEFDTGAHLKIALLAIPEGDDKPLKYTLMFSGCDALVITKIDTAEYFDFDIDRCKESLAKINPDAKVFVVSSGTGEGIASLAEWICGKYTEWREALQ